MSGNDIIAIQVNAGEAPALCFFLDKSVISIHTIGSTKL